MLMVALSLAGPRTARAQFSPGKLSRAHASIGGPTQCFQCHEPRKATTPERCLACHRELASRIAAGNGFHGRLAAAERARCGSCHAEHGGEHAALVRWPGHGRDAFDHVKAGFALEGKHAGLRCDACHKPELVRAEDVRAAKSLQLSRTHLGLSTRCSDCHTDIHRGQFEARVAKQDCAGCHGTEGWKKHSFDHSTARFRLQGRHQGLACDRCHAAVDESGARVAHGTPGAVVRYRPIDSASCAACHADPHQDRFGRDCARCHSAAGWKQLAPGTFDHSRTRYPLTGRHQQVECVRCHAWTDAAGRRAAAGTPGAAMRYRPIASGACTDCHSDPHRDRLGNDCARCHSTAGWSAVAAGAFDHDRTRYPLRGLHARVACEKCHHESAARRPLDFGKCTDCHADAHAGQLARRADLGACESCHTVDGFVPARFDPQAHAATRFALEGAHLAVPCIACHRPGASSPRASAAPAGPALASRSSDFQFHFASLACAACHADPHGAQFASRGVQRPAGSAAASATTDCARCHGLAAWRIPGFDHGKTRFALEGAHRRTACASCHRTVTVAGRSIVRYRPLDTACRSCHAEPVRPLGE
jgi:hypothetical protein